MSCLQITETVSHDELALNALMTATTDIIDNTDLNELSSIGALIAFLSMILALLTETNTSLANAYKDFLNAKLVQVKAQAEATKVGANELFKGQMLSGILSIVGGGFGLGAAGYAGIKAGQQAKAMSNLKAGGTAKNVEASITQAAGGAKGAPAAIEMQSGTNAMKVQQQTVGDVSKIHSAESSAMSPAEIGKKEREIAAKYDNSSWLSAARAAPDLCMGLGSVAKAPFEQNKANEDAKAQTAGGVSDALGSLSGTTDSARSNAQSQFSSLISLIKDFMQVAVSSSGR